MSVRSRISQFGLMLATALSVSLLTTAAHAYTPDQQQACTGDAFRVCGDAIPDVDRVTACMIRNKSQLSPGCRAFFRPDPEPELAPAQVRRPVAARRPVNIRPAAKRKPASVKPRKPKKPAR